MFGKNAEKNSVVGEYMEKISAFLEKRGNYFRVIREYAKALTNLHHWR